MAYIIACLMASLSFLLNRLLLKYIGNVTVVSISPVIEETAKTLLAYYLDADILLTHVTFGVLEGIYDWYGGRYGGKAALFSIVGHSLFGLLTVGGLYFTGSIWLSLCMGVAVHLTWNVTVIRLN